MLLSKKFIARSEEYNEFNKNVPAPAFRKSFDVTEKLDSAMLSVCGLGYYKFYINGKDITRGLLSSYTSNPNELLYYDVYDLKPHLKKGKNVLAFVLGNGFLNQAGGIPWGYDSAPFRSAPKLAVALELNGKLAFEADESFKTSVSPIIFDDLRAGEFFDANSENLDFYKKDFDDSRWDKPVNAQTPTGAAKINTAPPIKVYRSVKPKKIEKCGNGYVYDFGINSAGLFRLDVVGKKGQKVYLRFGEDYTNGEFKTKNIENKKTISEYNQICYYHPKDGKQSYITNFTYYGYRYVYVEGITEEQANKKLLTMLLASSDVKQRATFECSNKKINTLYRNCINSDRSNLFHIPTDCPHREKNGWTGDVRVSAEQFALNFDCENLMNEWLDNLCKAQNEEGLMPCVVPGEKSFANFLSVEWTGVVVELPYMLYKHGASKKILTDNYAMIKKYLNFVEKSLDDNGMIKGGFGDREEFFTEESSEYTTTPSQSSTLVAIKLFKTAKKISDILGDKEFSCYAEQTADKISTAFKNVYFKDGELSIKTQTAYALAIDCGLFSDNDKLKAVSQLKELIMSIGCSAKVGIIGFGVLYDVLSDNGEKELAYKIAMSENYPGFLYTINMGVTSMWESYSLLRADVNEYMRVDQKKKPSFNHHWYGHISAWVFKNIGGLKVDYTKDKPFTVEVDKNLPIDYAKLSFTNGNDYIRVSWKKTNGKVKIKVKSNREYLLK